MGRDPLLLWYAQRERILTYAELGVVLARNRTERPQMVKESAWFWKALTLEASRIRRRAAKERRKNWSKARPARSDLHHLIGQVLPAPAEPV